jgi:hypothetical protein
LSTRSACIASTVSPLPPGACIGCEQWADASLSFIPSFAVAEIEPSLALAAAGLAPHHRGHALIRQAAAEVLVPVLRHHIRPAVAVYEQPDAPGCAAFGQVDDAP